MTASKLLFNHFITVKGSFYGALVLLDCSKTVGLSKQVDSSLFSALVGDRG
jgi:hypothetical protein